MAWHGMVGFGKVFNRREKMAKSAKVIQLQNATDGGSSVYEGSQPYIASVTVRGVCPLLFHRWNVEAVEAKAGAAKGSAAKKTDDVESYLYRNEQNEICLPGEYLRQSIIHAAKFKQDPRSPRKSAMDLFKAGIVTTTDLASLGVVEPDFIDRRRVTVQRAGITRTRPAMREGWSATVDFIVNLPEYIDETLLRQVLSDAGRLVGVGDFRPSYGRFTVEGFELVS